MPSFDDRPEIECSECNGEGVAERIGGYDRPCDACHGEGWRPMTDEEWNDASEAAWSARCEGEPPMTMREQYEAAWKQKQELRR